MFFYFVIVEINMCYIIRSSLSAIHINFHKGECLKPKQKICLKNMPDITLN